MIEVEVKAKINSFKEMEERLEKLGAVKSKDEFQEDIYFASPVVRKEIEVNIEDSQKACEIFKEIGFEEVRHVKKKRKYYTYENFEISLDDVEGLNPYMEIEITLDDGKSYDTAQSEIFKLFEKLGITDGFERTSYLELLENLNND